MIVSTPTEFRFSECLKYLGRSKSELLHYVEQEMLLKAIKLNQTRILLKITSTSNHDLKVDFLNGQPTASEQAQVKDYIAEWFDLEIELAPFYRMAEHDLLLKSLVKQYYGLRLIKIHDLFQALCWAIMGQQINLTFAYTLYRRFIETFGQSFVYQGKTYWFFPQPEQIAPLDALDLTRLQLTGKKAEYIIGLARFIQNGELTKQVLWRLGMKGARERLIQIRGIGPWTANYVLMRCLGFTSAFPIEDVGLHAAIKKRMDLKAKPSIGQVRELASSWEGWQAYATFYLYRSLL